MTSPQPLLTERLYVSIASFFKKYRVPFFSALIFGFLAHMFSFTNKLVNHDELYYLFGMGATIGSGRWGLFFAAPFLPDASLPWLNGILTVLMIAVSICLIIQMFSIKNTVLQILLSALIITFPSLTGTFCFMFTSTYYGISFLLSVLVVWLLTQTQKHRWFWMLVSLGAAVLSTAIYQSYIAITASLFVLLLIQQLLQPDSDVKAMIKTGIFDVLFLAAALGCYWICCKIVWVITGIPMNAYSQEAVTINLSTIAENFLNAYRYFFEYTMHLDSGLITTPLSLCIHYGMMIILCIEILFWAAHTRKAPKIMLMLFLLAMFVLSINCMYIFVMPIHVHTLVLYSAVAIYIFAAVMIENGLLIGLCGCKLAQIRKVAYDLIIVGLTMVVIVNVYAANTAYLKLHLRYENLYSFCTSTAAHLESMPDYQQDTPVAVIGTWQDLEFYEDSFSGTEHLIGAHNLSPSSYSLDKMFEYYIGREVNLVYIDDAKLIAQTDAAKAMPSYPSHGYIQMIDGTIVIKLSD